MKNISFFIYDLNLGGAEKVVVGLANYFSANGFHVSIITIANNNYLAKDLLKEIKLISFNRKKIREGLMPLIKHIQNNKIDIFIANVWPITILTILAGFFKPGFHRKVLLVEHSHLSSSFSSHTKFFEFMQTLSARIFYPKSYKVIAVSKGVSDDLIHNKNLPKDCVEIIENPVIIPQNHQPNKASGLSQWVDFQGAKFISIGNLKDEKNYPYLLETLANLKKANFNFKQLIIGEGFLRPQLEELIISLDLQEEVILAGMLDAPFDLLKKADLFILSSKSEAFGIVMVEALAMGTTIVATDCECGPSDILKDGRFGYLAPLANMKKFSEIIIHAYANKLPADLLRKRSKKYSISSQGSKYAEVINRM